MVSQSVGGLGEFNYGIYYLPSISLGYLYSYTSVEASHSIVHIPNQRLWILSLLALISGAIFHRVSSAIFGVEGPGSNPKNKWVVRYYKYSLLKLERPESHPDNAVDIIRDIANVKMSGVLPYVLISTTLSLYAIYGPLYYYSLYLLTISIQSGSNTPIIGILLFLQVAILIRQYVSKLFPSAISPNARNWVDVPEYRRSEIDSKYDDISKRQQVIPENLFSIADRVIEKINRQQKSRNPRCAVAPVEPKGKRKKIEHDSDPD